MIVRNKDDWAISELTGQIQAIEAILLEMVDANTMRAAKESLRKMWKDEGRNKKWAELLDQINRPYEKHAEAALDSLICKAERKS